MVKGKPVKVFQRSLTDPLSDNILTGLRNMRDDPPREYVVDDGLLSITIDGATDERLNSGSCSHIAVVGQQPTKPRGYLYFMETDLPPVYTAEQFINAWSRALMEVSPHSSNGLMLSQGSLEQLLLEKVELSDGGVITSAHVIDSFLRGRGYGEKLMNECILENQVCQIATGKTSVHTFPYFERLGFKDIGIRVKGRGGPYNHSKAYVYMVWNNPQFSL
ncbi:MAG: hypothetical protein ABIC95_04400 [archaeon]